MVLIRQTGKFTEEDKNDKQFPAQHWISSNALQRGNSDPQFSLSCIKQPPPSQAAVVEECFIATYLGVGKAALRQKNIVCHKHEGKQYQLCVQTSSF